jgi:hypothetical protein
MANIQDSATRKMEKTKHPGIYRRGNRYVVVYRDPQGRQRKQFAATLQHVKDLKAILRADVKRGEYRTLSRIGFADYGSRPIRGARRGASARGAGTITGTRSSATRSPSSVTHACPRSSRATSRSSRRASRLAG